METTTKVCIICNQTKPLDAFGRQPKCKLGVRPDCKECRNRKTRDEYAQDKDKFLKYQKARRRTYSHRWSELKKKYGLTKDTFLRMFEDQNEQCAICLSPISLSEANVDHCHVTGRIRGLLCRLCNWGLGSFKDDVERLLYAIKYLNTTSDYGRVA